MSKFLAVFGVIASVTFIGCVQVESSMLDAPDKPLEVNVEFVQKDAITSIKETQLPSTALNGVAAVKLASGVILFQNSSYLEAWDPSTLQWELKASPPVSISQPSGFLLPDGRVLFVSQNLTVSAVYTPSTNSWTNIGAVTSEKSHPRIVQLADGKVYAMGGYSGSTASRGFFIFTPATNSWSQGPNMIVDRASMMAGALADGRLIVSGGFNWGSGPIRSAEVYNPTTNTWTAVANMVHNRAYGMSAIMKNGNYMVMGGAQNTSFLPSNSAQYYDINSNSFINLANMNRARYSLSRPLEAITLGNGKIVVGANGGTSGGGLEIYDPAANTWLEVNVPTSLSVTNSMVALDDDSFMLIDGKNSQIYNTQTATWTGLTTSLGNHSLYGFYDHRLSDGRVFFFGGTSGLGNQTTSIFNPETGLIAPGPNLPDTRSGSLWVTDSYGFAPMMIGSSSGGAAGKKVNTFNGAAMAWTSLPDTNQQRNIESRGLRLTDGSVVIIGGYDDEGYYSMTSEIYNPQSNQWVSLPNYDSYRRSAAGLSELPNGNVLLTGGNHFYEYYDADIDDYIYEIEVFASTRLLNRQTQTWSAGPSLNRKRNNHLQLKLNDQRILVLGGSDENGQNILQGEILSTQNNTWEAIADAPYHITAASMHKVLFDGRVLIWGVNNSSKVLIYNPMNDGWKEMTLSSARSLGQITNLANGKYLVFGGRNSSGVDQLGWDVFEPYDPKLIPSQLFSLAAGEDELGWLLAGNWLLPRSTETEVLIFNNSNGKPIHKINYTVISGE